MSGPDRDGGTRRTLKQSDMNLNLGAPVLVKMTAQERGTALTKTEDSCVGMKPCGQKPRAEAGGAGASEPQGKED